MRVSNETGGSAARSWVKAAAVAGLVFLVLRLAVGWGTFWSLLVAVVVLLIAGLVLFRSGGGDAREVFAQPSAAPAPARRATAEPAAPVPIAAEAPLVKPTAELVGEQDLASRKGSWRYQPETAPDMPAAQATVSDESAAPAAAPRVQPSTPLAGEAELASRKGSWRYTPPAAAGSAG